MSRQTVPEFLTNLERKRDYIIPERTDIQVEIEPVKYDDMANCAPAEPSSEIRKRVMAASEIQQSHFRDLPGIHCNAQMNTRLLRKYAWPDAAGLSQSRPLRLWVSF